MQALQTKSNIGEMFNIQEKENGEIAISGRELHQALEVKTRYNDWFERMINYGFEENIDYTALTQKRVT
ncbi:antA/AntB antirepressor family protein, partial [Staphylococcus aureus]